MVKTSKKKNVLKYMYKYGVQKCTMISQYCVQ